MTTWLAASLNRVCEEIVREISTKPRMKQPIGISDSMPLEGRAAKLIRLMKKVRRKRRTTRKIIGLVGEEMDDLKCYFNILQFDGYKLLKRFPSKLAHPIAVP